MLGELAPPPTRCRLPNLADGMRWLLGSYATWFNKRHGLTGHLFGDRFYSDLVEKACPAGAGPLHRAQSRPGQDGRDPGSV